MRENDFCGQYIQRLIDWEIGIGVVTNHNKFDKSKFVALKKKAKKNGIGLLPGVEFSLKEGIHILIIFDDKWYHGETDSINRFLENAFYGIANFDKPKYPNSNFSLKEAVEALDMIGFDYWLIRFDLCPLDGLFLFARP